MSDEEPSSSTNENNQEEEESEDCTESGTMSSFSTLTSGYTDPDTPTDELLDVQCSAPFLQKMEEEEDPSEVSSTTSGIQLEKCHQFNDEYSSDDSVSVALNQIRQWTGKDEIDHTPNPLKRQNLSDEEDNKKSKKLRPTEEEESSVDSEESEESEETEESESSNKD